MMCFYSAVCHWLYLSKCCTRILHFIRDKPAICHPQSQPNIIRKLVTLLDQLQKCDSFALAHSRGCISIVVPALPLLVLRILGL